MAQAPIIERRMALPWLRRQAEWGATAAGWALWLSLCRPLMAGLLWVAGARQFHEHMIRLGGWQAVVQFFGWYCYVIVGAGAALMSWNTYNRRRFRAHERRRQVLPVTGGEVEETFELPAGMLRQVHGWPECWVSFEPGGRMRLEPRREAR